MTFGTAAAGVYFKLHFDKVFNYNSLLCTAMDSIAVILQWACIYLAAAPEYQKKVVDYFQKQGATKQEFLDMRTCKNNPYLQACLSETWRIRHNHYMGMLHETTEDITVDGHYFPKGTIVAQNMWAMGHNKSWKNHNIYDPSRWIKNGL